jgi:hypothetical protein
MILTRLPRLNRFSVAINEIAIWIRIYFCGLLAHQIAYQLKPAT